MLYDLKVINSNYPDQIDVFDPLKDEKPEWLTCRLKFIKFDEADNPVYDERWDSKSGVTYKFPEFNDMHVTKDCIMIQNVDSGYISLMRRKDLDALYKVHEDETKFERFIRKIKSLRKR